MFNTELGLFCYMHDNWEELLTQEPYNLKISEDGPFVMFKYNQISSDFNNPIVREARGIIFKRDEWAHPVCWPFNKFGNFGESYVPNLDWDTAFVSEKVDGSLIKVWWAWQGGWHISTNGTIDAYKAELGDLKYATFGDYFEDVIKAYYPSFDDFVENLDFDTTYMFELVGPYNRVVVPYDEPAIYFLGARNKYTGEEYNCSVASAEVLGVNQFKLPKQYPLTSINDCVNLAATFTWEQEGFVACDANFNRVKIKSPAYVLAHFARNNNVITRKHLIKVVLQNEVDEFICYAADYENELRACQKLIDTYYKLGNSLAATIRKARNMSRSDFAELVKTFPRLYHDLLFKNYVDDISVEAYTAGWSENKWEDHLIELEKLKNELF